MWSEDKATHALQDCTNHCNQQVFSWQTCLWLYSKGRQAKAALTLFCASSSKEKRFVNGKEKLTCCCDIRCTEGNYTCGKRELSLLLLLEVRVPAVVLGLSFFEPPPPVVLFSSKWLFAWFSWLSLSSCFGPLLPTCWSICDSLIVDDDVWLLDGRAGNSRVVGLGVGGGEHKLRRWLSNTAVGLPRTLSEVSTVGCSSWMLICKNWRFTLFIIGDRLHNAPKKAATVQLPLVSRKGFSRWVFSRVVVLAGQILTESKGAIRQELYIQNWRPRGGHKSRKIEHIWLVKGLTQSIIAIATTNELASFAL